MFQKLIGVVLMACEHKVEDTLLQVHKEQHRNGCDCAGDTRSSCNAASDMNGWMWFCTRPKGHTGPHRACGSASHNILQWEQTNEPQTKTHSDQTVAA